MHILKINDVGKDFEYKWPDGVERFDYFVEYITKDEDGEHKVKIGFGTRPTYGKDRIRVVIWIDNQPQAEFFGTDDFDKTGEILSEIRIQRDGGKVTSCEYPEEPIPERYSMFNVVGLSTRVQGKGVHNAWAVVANIADHKTLINLAALRRLERKKAK